MNIKTISLALVLVAFACKKNEVTPSPSFENYAGIWVTYERQMQNDTVVKGPFPAKSIFGAYDPDIQLNKDKTYFPTNWNEGKVVLDSLEKGIFEYQSSDNKKILSLKRSGSGLEAVSEFKILKFEGDELWLEYTGDKVAPGKGLFKLKREMKQ